MACLGWLADPLADICSRTQNTYVHRSRCLVSKSKPLTGLVFFHPKVPCHGVIIRHVEKHFPMAFWYQQCGHCFACLISNNSRVGNGKHCPSLNHFHVNLCHLLQFSLLGPTCSWSCAVPRSALGARAVQTSHNATHPVFIL